jgi:hypothetical protein
VTIIELSTKDCVDRIPENTRAEWRADFEKIGEPRIRSRIADNPATLNFSTEKLFLAQEWLTSLDLAAASKRNAREEKTLSNSERATRIAISAIILSISMAMLEIIKWYSK